MDLGLFGLSLFFGFSVGLGAWVLLDSLREVKEELEEQPELYSTSLFFRVVHPLVQYMGRRIARIESSAVLDRLRGAIARDLTIAGKSLAITPDEFVAFMFVCSWIGLLVAGYFHTLLGLGLAEWLLLMLLVGYLPLLNLRERGQRRQKAIRKVLPYALDLLCLAVEAGLDFTAALSRIGENLKDNPFREELRLLARDLGMGKTRSEALRDMEKRVGIEELTGVVSALVQADELGASLGPTLRIQSEELQRKRFQRAEKKAMQAPVLMLIPLVVFIFPLVFLIIFTPIALQVLDQFQ
ncbi:MAG: type II secretion system F family protein [Planctomycetota bacterium]|nr:MAG: type II secretion system F family protein [Planctomycetota bacterium]